MGEEEVIEAVVENLKRELTELSDSEMDKCLSIWRDFSQKRAVGRTRKPETWSAAVYYVFLDISPGLYERVGQREAAERFGVSEGTVQAKQREIRDLLGISFIDGRYSPERAADQFKETMPPAIGDYLRDEFRIEGGSSIGREHLIEEVVEELYDQFNAVWEDLCEFAMEEFEGEIEDARDEFEEIRPLRPTDGGFLDWFTLDRESSRGEIPLELYLRERSDVIPSKVSDWIRLWVETEDQLYAVIDVNSEGGKLILANPMTGELQRAIDYEATEKLVPGLMVVTRLFPWPDAYHLSGDLKIFSVGLIPTSLGAELEETDVDPSEIELGTPLFLSPVLFERARLMEKDGLTDIRAFMVAIEEIAPAAVKLMDGDKSRILSWLDRYSEAIRMSLDRFGLDIEPSERIDEFNEPLTDDLVREWLDQIDRLSEPLGKAELIVANAVFTLLAKSRALTEGREIRRGDLRWAGNLILEKRGLLRDIIRSIRSMESM